MKKMIALVIGAGLVLSGCSLTGSTPTPSPSSTENQNMSNTQASASPTAMAEYALSDIAPHSSANDCWFAIDGKVYDVTKFIASGQHPGGDKILLGCGKDATELYHTKDGRGQDHSQTAQQLLSTFQIGVLK